MPLESEPLDELLATGRDLWKELADGARYSLELQNTSRKFVKRISNLWLPNEPQQKDDLERFISSSRSVFANEMFEGDAAKRLVNIIDNSYSELLELGQKRGVVNYIAANPEADFSIFVESETEAFLCTRTLEALEF